LAFFIGHQPAGGDTQNQENGNTQEREKENAIEPFILPTRDEIDEAPVGTPWDVLADRGTGSLPTMTLHNNEIMWKLGNRLRINKKK